MARVFIVGIVIAVAFTLYALVDAAMTDHSRARGVPKPVWIVLIVLLPVIGGLLWLFMGKGSAVPPPRSPVAPDDDPRFTGGRMSDAELEAHMRDLEARLKELDEETFPGEEPSSGVEPEPGEAENGGGSNGTGNGTGAGEGKAQ